MPSPNAWASRLLWVTIARLSRPIRKCCGSFQKSASPACLPAKQAFCMCIAVIGGMRFLTRSKLRFRRASRPSICVRRMLPVILKYLNEPVALQKWAALSISPRAAAAGWDPLRTRLSRRSKRMFRSTASRFLQTVRVRCRASTKPARWWALALAPLTATWKRCALPPKRLVLTKRSVR